MLSCKQASQLISQSLDRKLSFSERLGLRLHLLVCDVCTRFASQLALLRAAVKNMTTQIEQDESLQLPAEARQRIRNVVESGGK